MMNIKDPLLLIATEGVLSLNGPLPYVQYQITVNLLSALLSNTLICFCCEGQKG